MTELIAFILVFVSTLISLVVLGLAAGFSPTLYIAQIAVSTKTKKLTAYAVAVMSGVIAAILLLIVLFQIFQLDTLLTLIDTSVRALTVSVIFNVIVGALLVYGGIVYLHHQNLPKPKRVKIRRASGIIAIFGLGFARTFVSVSGVVATYIAGNIIGNVSNTILERLIYVIIFLVATVVPFIAILLLLIKNPEKLQEYTDKFKVLIARTNYRLIVGVAAIIFGSSIIIFNIMMALFY